MNEAPAVISIDRTPRLHTLVLPVSGRQVELVRGDMLEVQMRQIAGSGSAWSVEHAPEMLRFERDQHFPAQGGLFSTRVFRFRAVHVGAGLLRLVVGRAGDPLGHVDLNLTVTA